MGLCRERAHCLGQSVETIIKLLMMKARTVSALLCIIFASMTTAAVVAVEETPEEAQNSVDTSLLAEDVQGFEAVVPSDSEMAEVPENDDEADAAARMYCPPGWFSFGSRCYQYVSSHMNWINAEKHCVNQQAALASVRNPDEYQFLQNLAQIAGRTTAWIGGFYFQGSWMWIDRTGFYYQNWYSQSSVSSYPCMYMRSSGGWSNTNCASSLPFFCARSQNPCN
ncbi:ladderlectin-like [Sardina pilchardus]|uniref:ladderlectin-like n=1 Tax=Sardina pilchardus TaxID=27697 RepID=UPI002E0E1449